MNIQDYISSGIVESYVLGLASPEEQLEFEQLLAVHAELRQAKEAFEIGLESHALDNAIPVPSNIKQAIWAEIKPAVTSIESAPPSGGTRRAPVRPMGFARFLAAASVILLVASTALNFYFYNQYRSSNARLNELIASNQQLVNNNQAIQARLQQYASSFEKMKDPNMTVVAMKGQPIAPQSLTTVYWDKQTKDVYLMVNSLPQPGTGKQYQLWAIVDGKPVSAGLLDPAAGDGLVKMKNIPKAQAFAITLEKAGGSAAPTVPIYVMGQI